MMDRFLLAIDIFAKVFAAVCLAALAAFYVFALWCMIRNIIWGNP